jgi:hypothetical protein
MPITAFWYFRELGISPRSAQRVVVDGGNDVDAATNSRIRFHHGHLQSLFIHFVFPPSIQLISGTSQTPLMIYDPKTDPQLKSWLVKNLEPMYAHNLDLSFGIPTRTLLSFSLDWALF